MKISDRVWKQRTAALRNGRVPNIIKLSDQDVKAVQEELVSVCGSAYGRFHVDDIKLFDLPIDLTSTASHVLSSDGTRFDLESEG